jgi:heme o synthase
VTASQVIAPPQPRVKPRVRDYVLLTKPRIIELLLVTTIPVMFAAAGGWVSLKLLVATVLGGTFAAAGANVLNCVIDRDVDAQMKRTAHRGTATGLISARAATAFGVGLSIASAGVLVLFVNVLSATLAGAAIVAYVGGYTILLKRRTSSNIVWGGIAGCFPVLIGWASVRNSVSLGAIALFLLVFFWTPPHYWPLSMRFRDDYNRAGIPMLGAVASASHVARSIVLYTWVTVAISLTYLPLAHAGWIYGVVVSVAGVWFLAEAYRLQRSILDESQAMRLFHVSISYLTLVFLAVGLDPFLR